MKKYKSQSYIESNSFLDPYQLLANAIVLQAVKDYRVAIKGLQKIPDSKDYLSEKGSIERFFRSRWFGALTTIDPEYLIAKLRKEVDGK